jgi:hypothetical protein
MDNVGSEPSLRLLTKPELARHIRSRLALLIADESGAAPKGIAIYTLADPRDVREVRYVGQTQSPQRRYRQHLNAARLWLPDEKPWWVKSPQLRPLYEWIRRLYQDERRLPSMLICAWSQTVADARSAERARICECLQQRQPLTNFEVDVFGPQLPLL